MSNSGTSGDNRSSSSSASDLAKKATEAELASHLALALNLYVRSAIAFGEQVREAKDGPLRASLKASWEKVLGRAEKVKRKLRQDEREDEIERALEGLILSSTSHEQKTVVTGHHVLRQVGHRHGVQLPLWKTPSKQDFAAVDGQAFLDPQGLPALSNRQIGTLLTWARPSELQEPVVWVRGPGTEFSQDLVTDCSFVASLIICLDWEDRFQTLLVTNQLHPHDSKGRPEPSSNGKHVAKLFLIGAWRSISIDDRLPVSKIGTLMTLKGYQRGHEEKKKNGYKICIWPALLEKAYVKAFGGYDFKGSTSCIDCYGLTQWIPQVMPLQNQGENSDLWKELTQDWKSGKCIATLGTGAEPPELGAVITHTALLAHHCYAIVGMSDSDRTVRVRNPWQPETESGVQTKACTFDMDWQELCRCFTTLYLSWNIKLFGYIAAVHAQWPTEERNGLVLNVLYCPQFKIETSENCDIWVVLERHTKTSVTLDDYAQISVFNSQTRMEEDNKAHYASTGYTDSPLQSIKLTNVEASSHVLVVSRTMDETNSSGWDQADLNITQHNTFSVVCYANSSIKMHELPQLNPYHHTIQGEWTLATSAGPPSSSSYLNNPQYLVNVPGSIGSTMRDILLVIETTSRTAVHGKLFHMLAYPDARRLNSLIDAKLITSSGSYRYGSATLKAKDIRSGTYFVILSQLDFPERAPFRLRIQSSLPLRVSEAPALGAGSFQTKVFGSWSGSKAAGNPNLGKYHDNPKFRLMLSSSTNLTLKLDPLRPKPSSTHHAGIFEYDPSADGNLGPGLGKEVASSPSYISSAHGIVLENLHLQPRAEGYLVVPSSFHPVEGDFVMTMYTDRKIIMTPLV